jgi:hypothetical protein
MRVCEQYGVDAHNITVKGKDSRQLSFSMHAGNGGALNEMCEDIGFTSRLSRDEFLPTRWVRVQLDIGGQDPVIK